MAAPDAAVDSYRVDGVFQSFSWLLRYTGVKDALDTFKAVGQGSFAFLIIERWIAGQKFFPRFGLRDQGNSHRNLAVGVRVFSHALRDALRRHSSGGGKKTVVIVGAGCVAATLL